MTLPDRFFVLFFVLYFKQRSRDLGYYGVLDSWVSPGVYVSGLNGVEEEFGHSDALHVDEVGLEQSLGGLKALSSHLDHTAIWQLETCGRE